MSADPKKPQPERVQTDESLRTERKNTDHVLEANTIPVTVEQSS